MSIDDFIESSKNEKATEQDIINFEERIKKREEQFENQFGKIDKEFMDREYTV